MHASNKNVVFLHMESLNQLIFNHRHLFPNINNIHARSLRFNNFISTATSSLMAFSDLLHGDDNTLEHNVNLEENISVIRQTPSLFDQFKAHGYLTSGMGYPKNWASVDSIWSEDTPFNWYDTSDEMLSEMKRIVNQDEPFALYLWNLSSHLCYYDPIKNSGSNSMMRWQRGYQSMDLMVGQVLKCLLDANKLNNTIIVGFGDHGDDFWCHGFNGGYAHGIEPYTSLIHTPAFIFCPGLKSTDINSMVSMLDLHNTTLALLNLPTTPNANKSYFALSPKRQYCYSRNLFAQQKSQHNGSPLKKGYSITSEIFHLLKVEDRFSMYLWKTDPTNQFDVLPLLKYNQDGIPFLDLTEANQQRIGGAHPHIRHFFGNDMASLIDENYRKMKGKLEEWITGKSNYSNNPK